MVLPVGPLVLPQQAVVALAGQTDLAWHTDMIANLSGSFKRAATNLPVCPTKREKTDLLRTMAAAPLQKRRQSDILRAIHPVEATAMEILNDVLLILACAGGALVQRVTGFGMGIFAMLFLPYFLPSSGVAAAVVGLLSCCSSIYNAVRKHKHIQWKTLVPLTAAALLVIPAAVFLSAYLPAAVMKRLLGVVLIILSAYFLFFSKHIQMKATVGSGLLAGALGGLLNGLFSTGGPPVVLYLIHATTDNLTYFATIQAYFAITNVFATVNRFLNGIIDAKVLLLAAVALIGTFLGNALGGKVFDRLDADRLRKAVYIGMLLSGLLMALSL